MKSLTERKIEESIDAMVSTISKDDRTKMARHLIQYVKEGNTFRPAGAIELVPTLEPCGYVVEFQNGQPVFTKKEFRSDDLYLFEGSKMYQVIEEIDKFWTLKSNFDKLGFLHNRGLIMYGPPGTGKTCVIRQVVESMQKQGDVVIIAHGVGEIIEGLKQLREVEPDRKLVVVFEDMDEYIGYSERAMLQLLDGNNSVDNCLFLGTTNYIEKFPPRLLRPGRFDKKVKIDYPPMEGRLVYLKHKLTGVESPERIQRLAEKTKGFSFGHLRELIIAGYAFKEPVDSVIERLQRVDYTELPQRDEKVVESVRRK